MKQIWDGRKHVDVIDDEQQAAAIKAAELPADPKKALDQVLIAELKCKAAELELEAKGLDKNILQALECSSNYRQQADTMLERQALLVNQAKELRARAAELNRPVEPPPAPPAPKLEVLEDPPAEISAPPAPEAPPAAAAAPEAPKGPESPVPAPGGPPSAPQGPAEGPQPPAPAAAPAAPQEPPADPAPAAPPAPPDNQGQA